MENIYNSYSYQYLVCSEIEDLKAKQIKNQNDISELNSFIRNLMSFFQNKIDILENKQKEVKITPKNEDVGIYKKI